MCLTLKKGKAQLEDGVALDEARHPSQGTLA